MSSLDRINRVANAATLLPINGAWTQLLDQWLAEDVPLFDYGGFVVGDGPTTATVFMKSGECILAGVPFANLVFERCKLEVKWNYAEGDHLSGEGKIAVAHVSGPVNQVLIAERTALNLLSRALGIATALYRLLLRARESGYTGLVAGTRKTTPGLRVLEKYAMIVGGVDQHRYDLLAMVMLKDNHIWACGGDIGGAIAKARQVAGFAIKVEVEVALEEDARRAIEAGADIVMLDNFSTAELRAVALRLKTAYKGTKHEGLFLLECSGGLTLDNLAGFLCQDVDVYSTSSIHQGTGVIDFSMKVDH